MKSQYIIGIDLGTTNSAVAYTDLHDTTPGDINILSFKIPQLVGQGMTGERSCFPSFIYLPGEYDLQHGDIALPWDSERSYAAGLFARDQGGKVPGRLVSSAKSWLCHGGVDREAPILPWGAEGDVPRISPLEASARYLQHLKEAWHYVMSAPMEEQNVVLTVPASFDEIARELTLKAAEMAGLGKPVLLEEPLAAFYSWLSGHEADWNDFIKPDEWLLICDVGGGTTDFTIVGCVEGDDGPRLERIAVGDHLLLGGDNVDLAITAMAERKMGADLDHASWQMLYHQCRQAKETLLSPDPPDNFTVRVAGRGSSLIGGSLTASLGADEVKKAILDGFYPTVPLDSVGDEHASALREMGLPYEKDPAVTRHLARFLLRQGEGVMPSLLLLNGGSLTPAMLQERIRSQLSEWAENNVRLLENISLDLAISRGAVYYGLVKQGIGFKVGGGTARSYYAGISSENNKPQAICLIEKGTEEGETVELDREFRVIANRPVKFSLYCSSMRKGDRAGDVINAESGELVRLPPLQTVLKYGKKGLNQEIPVKIGATITSLGILELFYAAVETPHKWRLQFQLRDKTDTDRTKQTDIEGVRVANGRKTRSEDVLTEEDRIGLAKAEELIRNCFDSVESSVAVSPVELPALLVGTFGMEKDRWRLPLLRALADIFLDVRQGRTKSIMHESRWFNMAGFCMRPGTGESSDPWRMKTIWSLYFEGLVHSRQPDPRLQWWIFWRRVSAGLSKGHQTQMFTGMSHAILPRRSKRAKRQGKQSKKYSHEETRQMWLYAASLERLEVGLKVDAGRQLLTMLKKSGSIRDTLWCLGRIGAREPLYGPVDRVIPPEEVAKWLDIILKQQNIHGALLADSAISMARVTGDRTRDLPSEKREDVLIALQLAGITDEEQLKPLKEYVEIMADEKSMAFGENLPEGLVLTSSDTGEI